MSTRNDGRPNVVPIKNKPLWRFLRGSVWARRAAVAVAFVAATIVIVLVILGWFRSSLLPANADAGPTRLTASPNVTVIQSVDFDCKTAVTSAGTYVAFDPGWELWFLSGGQAGVAFDVVGDYDLCLWANDYRATANHDTGTLEVVVERVDARRPRVTHEPWEHEGVTYRTLELSSAGGGMLADANFDRTVYEGVHNFFSGNDQSYISELTTLLLRRAENEILNTSCMDDALQNMRQGLQEHFFNEAFEMGLSDVSLSMPDGIEIPDNSSAVDSGDVEFNRVGRELCLTEPWEATPAG